MSSSKFPAVGWRQHALAGWLAATLLAAGCAPTPFAALMIAPPAPPPAVSAAGPVAFTGQLAHGHVVKLATDIGIRAAGTPNDAISADYIADTFRASGYIVDVQTFPFTYFEDKGSSLKVVDGEAIECKTFTYSAAGDLTGQLVFAGLGRPGDFPADAAGKIVLIERGELTFQAKIANAEKAGAIGAIIHNNAGEIVQGTLGRMSAIPVVAISQSDGEKLRAQLASGPVTVNLTTRTLSEGRTSSNVVARLSGASGPRIVVGGHRDSVPAGPGANDNGSGIATMLEMARVVALQKPAIDYHFVAFGAEELGLVGSRYYVNQLSTEERNAITLMINLDMVGVGDRMLIGGTDELVAKGQKVAGRKGVTAGRLGAGLNSASDHASFMAAGIPALFLNWSNDPAYHTNRDQADNVRPELLEKTGAIALAIGDLIANPSD